MQWSISQRPHTLEYVYGCDTVKKYYYNLVKSKKEFPTAVLLEGQYGSGKTTIAKIISQMMVCQNPKENGDPCCECLSCKSIIDETFNRDVMMIDGGVGGKIDTVRDTVTKFIATPPMRDRKKILIIEEFQEWSKDAVNAMLKILESPKKNIHFIFTAMKDMPASGIKSRCQTFKFKPANFQDIMLYLKSQMENIKYKDTNISLWDTPDIPKEFKLYGLKYIADSADGSYRAAIQYLEQCIDSEIYKVDLTSDEAKNAELIINNMKQNFGFSNSEDITNMLVDISNGNVTETLFNSLTTGDYEKDFRLGYKIISDCVCYKAFRKIPGENQWLTNQTLRVLNTKHFDYLQETFETIMNMCSSYFNKSLYIIEMCKLVQKCKEIDSDTKILSERRTVRRV